MINISMKRVIIRGFTLVEILIVVTVVGIIAGVGVVSYSGHAQRARNTARLDAANSYVNILDTMIAKDPTILQGSTLDRYCLGTWFKDISSPTDGKGDCYVIAVGDTDLVSVNSTKNTDMLKIVGTLPNSPPEPVVGADGKSRIGPFATFEPVSGSSWGRLYVNYVLEKPAATTCPSGVEVLSDAKTLVCKMKVQTDPNS